MRKTVFISCRIPDTGWRYYLLAAHYVPSTVLGTGDTAGNETDPVPSLRELTAEVFSFSRWEVVIIMKI